MYVTHEEYTRLDYNVVPAAVFSRFGAMAENFVRKYTQNRIKDSDLRPETPDEEAARIAEMNQRGMCEIIDEFYIAANPNSAAAKERRAINSFSNADYSENYGSPRYETSNTEQLTDPKLDILNTYFTQGQLWRGRDARPVR